VGHVQSTQLAEPLPRQSSVGEALLLLAQGQRLNGQTVASAATARRAAQSLADGLGDAHSRTREARALADPQILSLQSARATTSVC
jgi:hypothetical protein